MEFYSVTDGYIDYLSSVHTHVYSNKEITRKNPRKYLGVVFENNGYKYFIPLSSPKKGDFVQNSQGVKEIRKDTYLIFRIVSHEKDGDELKGTLRIANMIPVPESELLIYDVNYESDVDYKNLVLKEQEYVRKNSEKIISRAKNVYNKHKCGNTEKIMELCLDYTDLERMHDEWKKLITDSDEGSKQS